MTLRVATIGCGFQGRLHLACLSDLPDVEIVAVCDVDAARAGAAAEAHGARAYSDYRELLAAERVDLLTICTMPNTHRAIAVEAFARGAHVFCEKPFALNLGEAREIAEAALAADRLLAIGFNLRYTDCAASVRRFIGDGGLGAPVCARGWMLAEDVPWWGRHYDTAVSGGGALAATAVHMLDLVLWLAGNPAPVTATASTARIFPRKRAATAPSPEAAAAYDAEDVVFGHIRCEGGFWLSIEGSWVWDDPGGGWNYSFDLVGDHGQARLVPLRLTREVDGRLADVTGDAPALFDFEASTRLEVRDVVAAVREGRAPLVRPEQALAVQAAVDALYRSARLGHEVEVERV